MIFFAALNFYFLIKAMNYTAETNSGIGGDIFRFIAIALGSLFVILGYFLPQVPQNKFVGVRTKWSLKSDIVWQKSQRFAGIGMVICGFILIIFAIVIRGAWNIVPILTVVPAWVVVSAWASYFYYKKDFGAKSDRGREDL